MDVPKIEVRGLWEAFGSKQVLRGVDLAVAPGESLVLLGASGTGKSVLLKHLIGLMAPDRGSVLVDGTDLTHAPKTDWLRFRRRCGMAFQEGALFDSMNVFDNIAFPLRRHASMTPEQVAARVCECLATVQLDGAGTKATGELSGGMRRRVGFARAIALRPEVLLFDEPHSGLDPITAAVIDRVIGGMRREMDVTLVTITHDVRAAFRIADRIAVLRNGRILADGPPGRIEASADPFIRSFLAGEPYDDEGEAA
jgi:phospholipid/cholesterol/gamma-HCH transport system ATP-binding protein